MGGSLSQIAAQTSPKEDPGAGSPACGSNDKTDDGDPNQLGFIDTLAPNQSENQNNKEQDQDENQQDSEQKPVINQDPDYMLKFEDEELRWQQVMSRISFYKHEIEKAITHGYHDESMASYDGGVHH